MGTILSRKPGGTGGGGGPPSGPAGGDLSGTYPNPDIAANVVGANEIDGGDAAAIRTELDVPSNAQAVLDAIFDAKGDILTATAADTPARLAAGATDGMVLQVLAAAASGLAWATPAFQVLFDSTLGGDAASIDTGANGVAQTHSHLLIVGQMRTAQAAVGGQVNITFNNDTGSNYDDQRVTDTNVTLGQGISLATTFIGLPVNGANALASTAGIVLMFVPCYRQTTFHKSTLAFSSVTDDTAADRVGRLEWGGWRSTSAISRVAATGSSGNVVTGSRMTIFGLGPVA